MLHVEDWAEIRRLHFAEDLPIKAIARLLGISKNTVKAKLAADAPPSVPFQSTTGGALEPSGAARSPTEVKPQTRLASQRRRIRSRGVRRQAAE